eukprot:495361-Pleurochrysis_carterae.AAC.1
MVATAAGAQVGVSTRTHRPPSRHTFAGGARTALRGLVAELCATGVSAPLARLCWRSYRGSHHPMHPSEGGVTFLKNCYARPPF